MTDLQPWLATRRRVLQTAGVAGAAGVTGCVGLGGDDEEADAHDHGDHEHTHGGDGHDFTPIDRSTEELPAAQPSEVVRLEDGETFQLRAAPVRHDPGTGEEIAMYAYNGQLPGPTLRAPTGAEIHIEFENDLPYETTVHWHGVRLDVAFDGVPDLTQEPVQPGETFDYRVELPDEGVFWYHPHVREDIQQHLGLRGGIVVEGPRADGETWPHEEMVMLSDLKLVDGDVYPLWEETANHAVMGRFGTHLLANGTTDWTTRADPGERLRLHLVNVANVRPFQVQAAGAAETVLVGQDGGFLPEPTPVSEVLLSPSERATVDVVMPEDGDVRLLHVTPHGERELGTIESTGAAVVDTPAAPASPHERAEADLSEVMDLSGAPVDVTWELDVEMADELHEMMGHGDMGHDDGMDHDDGMEHGEHGDGPPPIEWEDEMEDVNEVSTAEQVTHIIRDRDTGLENMDADYSFEYGSYVRIKIDNPPDTMHPMQHPIHLHGVHFLVDTIDGEPNPHPSWKDTAHVSAGSEVVLTIPMDNPGTWMHHCHISEHLESGMMGTFTVEEP